MKELKTISIKEKLKNVIPNKIINASMLYKQFAGDISEAAFYKMLERMTKNGELFRLAKGLYYRPKVTSYGIVPVSEDEIINYYVENKKGMIIGYALYNSRGITTQVSKKIVILSNRLVENKKQVANITVTRVDLRFDDPVVAMIELLELLQEIDRVEDIDYVGLQKYLNNVIEKYSDEVIDRILSVRRYKKSTIYLLRTILGYHGIENSLNKYLSALSQYRVMDVRRMYESA